MVDMTNNEENKKYFITDISYDDKSLRVTRADGSVSDEPFSLHNLGFYRTKMIEGAQANIDNYMDDLSKKSFFVVVKKWSSVIISLLELFLLYNIDIHIIIKIILAVLVVLGEIGYYLYNEILLGIMHSDVVESLATEYYLKNLNEFKYYDKEGYTDGYIVPPEDISKYHLTQGMLEQIIETIKSFKEQGFLPEEMSLSYKREPENGKSML